MCSLFCLNSPELVSPWTRNVNLTHWIWLLGCYMNVLICLIYVMWPRRAVGFSLLVLVIFLTHFWPMPPFYTPLKSPENLWFSGIFRGYKMGILVRNGLISTEKQREPRQVANNLLETKSSCIMQYFFPMFSWNFAQCLSDLYCRFSSHLWEANFL